MYNSNTPVCSPVVECCVCY